MTETSSGDGTTQSTTTDLYFLYSVNTLLHVTLYVCFFRFSYRKREEKSQRDPVDRGPEQLPGHSDEDQSKIS